MIKKALLTRSRKLHWFQSSLKDLPLWLKTHQNRAKFLQSKKLKSLIDFECNDKAQ